MSGVTEFVKYKHWIDASFCEYLTQCIHVATWKNKYSWSYIYFVVNVMQNFGCNCLKYWQFKIWGHTNQNLPWNTRTGAMMTGWNNYGNSTHHATQNQTNQRVGKKLDFKIDSHVQNHVHIQKHLNSSCTFTVLRIGKN